MYRRLLPIAAGVATLIALVLPVTTAEAATGPLYNSAVTPSAVGNIPSVGAEAYAFNEFGNQVTLTGTHLSKVTVTMSSWGCQTGHWNTGDCHSASGSKFAETITFNIYNAPAPNSDVPGSLIASVTKPFNIPYRPSASYAHCFNSQAGEWWDSTLHSCFNGKAVNISFAFNTNLPSTNIVFGIAYNTTHYGYNPIGEGASCYGSSGGCGYDSLNIGLSQDPTDLTAGSDPNPGTVWQYSSQGSEYCDGGAAGTSVFRLDSPSSACWSVNSDNNPPYYIPAVKFARA